MPSISPSRPTLANAQQALPLPRGVLALVVDATGHIHAQSGDDAALLAPHSQSGQVGRHLGDCFPNKGTRTQVEQLLASSRPAVVQVPPRLHLELTIGEASEGLRLVLVRDISEQVELVRKLQHAAATDWLTGLANRAAFEGLLSERVAAPDGFAVVVLDFDDFKRVNDELGHAAGDELLRQAASRLRRAVRPGHDQVARLGGDEFAIAIPVDSLSTAARHCAAIQTALQQRPYSLDGTVRALRISLGGIFSPGPHAAPSQLLAFADQAMYRAKRRPCRRLVLTTRP